MFEPDVVTETDGFMLGDGENSGAKLVGSLVIKSLVGLLEGPIRPELVADNLELSMP